MEGGMAAGASAPVGADAGSADSVSFPNHAFPLRFDSRPRYPLAVEVIGEGAMESEKIDLPQGTLDLLLLKVLALEALHGWAISERLQQMSHDAIQVQQGSLYPALHRLERKGWIRSQWAISENSRRARYYELTARGRKHLAAQTTDWRRLTAAVDHILGLV
jgi:transcriptional regulator